MKSPIGQEELVRQFISYTTGVISQVDNPEIVDVLMEYINSYAQPILERHKGLSFGQTLYLNGMLDLTAYQKTFNAKYLKAAKNSFDESYLWGGTRPQPLYGLFDICRIEKNISCVKAFATQILHYWPDAFEIKKAYEEFLNQNSTSSKK